MSWKRLYLVVEGETELQFSRDVLSPHLELFEIALNSMMVVTNRKLNKKGGVVNFSHVKNELVQLTKQHTGTDVYFSTMLDLYALPSEFPAWNDAQKHVCPTKKVDVLEQAFKEVINDSRFLPYIQLHEFEALLYCDLSQLAQRIPNSEQALDKLKNEVAGLAPEEINAGKETAPSKRIIKYVPLYEKVKVRVGAPAVAAIGLPTLRSQCPHFNQWLNQLEQCSSLSHLL